MVVVTSLAAVLARLGPPTRTGCREFIGARSLGYGVITAGPGTRSLLKAHRLVCEATYGPPPSDRPYACHTCDNRACCEPTHLYWGSPGQNLKDVYDRRRRRVVSQPGGLNSQAKLTDAQVDEVRAAAAAGESQRSIAARMGVSQMAIWKMIHGVSYRLPVQLTAE